MVASLSASKGKHLEWAWTNWPRLYLKQKTLFCLEKRAVNITFQPTMNRLLPHQRLWHIGRTIRELVAPIIVTNRFICKKACRGHHQLAFVPITEHYGYT